MVGGDIDFGWWWGSNLMGWAVAMVMVGFVFIYF